MQKPSEVATVNLSYHQTTRLVNFILQFLFYYILVQFEQTFISTNNNKAPQREKNQTTDFKKSLLHKILDTERDNRGLLNLLHFTLNNPYVV
jgi:hypothetical protein